MRDDAPDDAQTDADGDSSVDDIPTQRLPSASSESTPPTARLSAPRSVAPSDGSQPQLTPVRPGSVASGRSDDERLASNETNADRGAGTVSLVGSGPGDPELLTRRAWNRLSEADVVLHDSLTGDEILEELSENTEVIDVGKHPPNRTPQEDINELMVDRSRQGQYVVRLKGGDPNVFGRGGEEAEYLAAEDVAFEVVPGISSVLAAPSVSGIPLTHRHRSSSVTVITGHQTPDKDESALDWNALAATILAGGTLVILMGVRRLSENVRALRDHQVPPETPVGMIQKATWQDEQILTGTLETIVGKCQEAEIGSPATTIVGDVVGVRSAVEAQFLE